MTDSRRPVGVHLSEGAISHYDALADEYDTDRAAVMRALLTLGSRFAGQMERKGDEDRLRSIIEDHEAQTAPEMTADGHHPRWDSSKHQ